MHNIQYIIYNVIYIIYYIHMYLYIDNYIFFCSPHCHRGWGSWSQPAPLRTTPPPQPPVRGRWRAGRGADPDRGLIPPQGGPTAQLRLLPVFSKGELLLVNILCLVWAPFSWYAGNCSTEKKLRRALWRGAQWKGWEYCAECGDFRKTSHCRRECSIDDCQATDGMVVRYFWIVIQGHIFLAKMAKNGRKLPNMMKMAKKKQV